jgi:hypothetical protein
MMRMRTKMPLSLEEGNLGVLLNINMNKMRMRRTVNLQYNVVAAKA